MKNIITKISKKYKKNKYHSVIQYILSTTLLIAYIKVIFGAFKFIDEGEFIIKSFQDFIIFLAIIISFLLIYKEPLKKIISNAEFKFKDNKIGEVYSILPIIFILFYSGNPFINNYYGISINNRVLKYDRNLDEYYDNEEIKTLVIDKKLLNDNKIRNFIIKYFEAYYLDEFSEETKDDFVKNKNKLNFKNYNYYNFFIADSPTFFKKGYVFKEAAFFDGYYSNEKEYNFIAKLKYLFFYIIEQLIKSFFFFLLPLSVYVIYILYFDKPIYKESFVILSVIILPLLFKINYPSISFHNDIYTTYLLYFISAIHILIPVSIKYYEKNKNKHFDREKIIKILNRITIITIITFFILKAKIGFGNESFEFWLILFWYIIMISIRKNILNFTNNQYIII